MDRELNFSSRLRGCVFALGVRVRSFKILVPLMVLGTVWLLAGSEGSANRYSGADQYGWRPLAPSSPFGSTNRCISCHRLDPLHSHPVEVAPSMAVPAELPLEMGRITCLTCHLDGGPAAHARSSQLHDGMIRSADSRSLCAQCHTSVAATPQAMHPLALGKAHLKSQSRTGSVSLASQGLDAETRTCMGCHDGMIAREGEAGMGFAADTSRDHPIGVAYADSRMARGLPRSDVPLKPIIGVDPRIRLFDGQIGCGSCHSLYSGQKKLLVMSNLGSKLCLSCHRA